MIPRVHASGPMQPGDTVDLDADEQHYLRTVMRARSGDPVQVFDGAGRRMDAVVDAVERHRVSLRIRPPAQQPQESASTQAQIRPGTPPVQAPALRITLIQSISTADKMDWTVEKATELGVSRIVPVSSRRSLVRLTPEKAQARREHWQRVALAACRQSGNDRLPLIDAPVALDRWLQTPADAGEPEPARLVLSAPADGGAVPALSRWQPATPHAPVQLLVGPESGFDESELALALHHGFLAQRLGPRTLRTETAGLVAIAVLQSRFGDI